jgi:ActR/RegA family two-component response regulator
MKSKKEKPLVWLIEDDSVHMDFLKKCIQEDGLDQHLEFQYFESAFDTIRETARPKYIVQDIAAISVCGQSWDTITAHVKNLICRHPEAIFLIYSAIEIYAKDAVEEIENEFEDQNQMVFCVKHADPAQWWTDVISKFER